MTDLCSFCHMNRPIHRSILKYVRKCSSDLNGMGAIKRTIELIAHSLCVTNSAPTKVARQGRPGKMALLNGQSMQFKSEQYQSPELTDAHGQLIVGLKAHIPMAAKPMARHRVICAKLCPLPRGSLGRRMEILSDLLTAPRQSAHGTKAFRVPIPRQVKEGPMLRSLNCCPHPQPGPHWRTTTSSAKSSSMLSQRMPRCKLPSGKSDNQRMNPSTMDHQLSSHGVSANPLKMIWGMPPSCS